MFEQFGGACPAFGREEGAFCHKAFVLFDQSFGRFLVLQDLGRRNGNV
jgi:hypothetical protein